MNGMLRIPSALRPVHQIHHACRMDERVAGIHRHCDSDFLVTHACLGGGIGILSDAVAAARCHAKLESTVRYIGIEVGDAFEMT